MKSNQDQIVVVMDSSNLDKASDSAVKLTHTLYGITPDGHSSKIDDFDRSSDSIFVEFKSLLIEMTMTGMSYNYIFDTWIEKGNE